MSTLHSEQTKCPVINEFWSRFLEDFPSEAHCLAELIALLGNSEPICSYCGRKAASIEFGLRYTKCACCKRLVWATAGTFFENIRCPRAWLGALFLLGAGVPINAGDLQRLAGIARSSASNIIQKILMVITEEMIDVAQVFSSEFETIIYKRSRETPARQHPRAEIDNLSDSANCQLQGGATPPPVDTAELGIEEKLLFEEIWDQPIHFDVLIDRTGLPVGKASACVVMLEFYRLIERLPGEWYIRRAPKQIKAPPAACAAGADMEKVIENANEFIRDIFKGVSRKFLQNYLSAYWCWADRGQWTFMQLASACVQHRWISDKDVRNYVSPAWVSLPVE